MISNSGNVVKCAAGCAGVLAVTISYRLENAIRYIQLTELVSVGEA